MRDEATYPAEQLAGAFLPALKLHLGRAYGWFLLSASGVEQVAEPSLPRDTADLPAPDPGRARPPELGEFALLEQSGWIGDMLREEPLTARSGSGAGGLLISDQQRPGYAIAASWVDSLAQIMARMDDSLAEY
jgi:hypothetical protein